MTTNEVFDKITSIKKWYGGVISPQSASRIIRKHKDGTYNNYKWFFALFGYTKNETTWLHSR